MVKDRLLIGEVSKQTGVFIRTIRFYEAEGLLSSSGRRPSGYRVYTEQDMEKLHFIQQAKRFGLRGDQPARLVLFRERQRSGEKIFGLKKAGPERVGLCIAELRVALLGDFSKLGRQLRTARLQHTRRFVQSSHVIHIDPGALDCPGVLLAALLLGSRGSGPAMLFPAMLSSPSHFGQRHEKS